MEKEKLGHSLLNKVLDGGEVICKITILHMVEIEEQTILTAISLPLGHDSGTCKTSYHVSVLNDPKVFSHLFILFHGLTYPWEAPETILSGYQ